MIRKLICRVRGHIWKSQISGKRVISWDPSEDSYVVCERCGLSFSRYMHFA